MRRTAAVLIVTLLFYLAGAYIELSWLWLVEITRGSRAGVLALYLFLVVATATCPFIQEWE